MTGVEVIIDDTPGTEIAEIGHILLEYLENKTKLEKKYRRKKR
jgi:hypothetical protein